MKKNIYFFIILVTVTFAVSAQKAPPRQECNFLGALHYKNGKATVVLKATYTELFRDDESPTFRKLQKQKKLFIKDYFNRCCSGTDNKRNYYIF